MSILIALLGFLVAIAVLVFVHEYGHFKVARLCGVKVRRFSIGFGKPLFRRTDRHGTEWSVAWAPLGGYVLFADGRNEELSPEEEKFAFDRKPLWARSAIVAAGPLANLLFAFVAFWALGMAGSPEPKPFLGAPTPASVAAKAGFEPRDRILSIDGAPVRTISQAHLALADAAIAGGGARVEVQRHDGTKASLSLDFDGFDVGSSGRDFMRSIGFPSPGPLIPSIIGHVSPGSPAAKAGLLPGDRIIMANGAPVALWSEFMAQMAAGGEKPIALLLLGADGSAREVSAAPVVMDKTKIPKLGVGVDLEAAKARRDSDFEIRRLGPIDAAAAAAQRSWSVTAMTLSALGGMITGQHSLQAISGPIGIAEMAGGAAERGFESFLSFMAFISLSLFLMNLLPIPALDGGHLLQYGIEGVIRRPLSVAAQHAMAKVGFAFLGLLMVVAIGNDLLRLFG